MKKMTTGDKIILIGVIIFSVVVFGSFFYDLHYAPEPIPKSFKFDVGDEIIFTASPQFRDWEGKRAIILDRDENHYWGGYESYQVSKAYHIMMEDSGSKFWIGKGLIDGYAKKYTK